MQLIKAFFLCTKKHWKQRDKAGKRYIYHPMIVMLNVKGYKEKTVALLHDIVEDTDVDISQLKAMKFNGDIVDAVEIITKKKGQEYQEYLSSVKNNKIARSVKIADLKHNMDLRRIKTVTAKDIQRRNKYEKALIFLQTE